MRYLRPTICGLVFSLSIAPAFAEELTFIDVPEASGQLGTQATGINARGDIVGIYVTDTFNMHGFLLSNGTFTTIDVPGATFPGPPTTGGTFATAINPQGDIVGYYNDSSLGSGGTFATAINPQGDIVGYYNDSSLGFRGFLLSGGTFTTIDVPGSGGTTAPLGINARGDIVGSYFDSVSGHVFGFLLRDGAYSTIAVPGADATGASGINSRGDIVGGYYEGPLFASHGFLLTSGGTLTTIDVPGGAPGSTLAVGINPRGDIVGTYIDSDGFLSTWLRRDGTFTAPISQTIHTPVCECQGIPAGINARGDVVGLYYDAVAVHGFLLSR